MRKSFILMIGALLFLASASVRADLIFFIEQIGGPNPIVVGNTAEFGLFLGSTTFGGDNTPAEQPISADFRATLEASDGSVGSWTSGSNLQSGVGFDPNGFPTHVAQYTAFWGNPALAFPAADTRYQIALLILNTTAATPGEYSISLDELAAISAENSAISVVNGGAATYSLAPIPEPTTLSILAWSMVGIMIKRRRR